MTKNNVNNNNNNNNNDPYGEFQLLKDELFYLATLMLQRLFTINNNNNKGTKISLTQTAIEEKSKTLLLALHDYLNCSYPELSREEKILLINKTIDRVKEVTQRVTKHWC